MALRLAQFAVNDETRSTKDDYETLDIAREGQHPYSFCFTFTEFFDKA